MFVAVPPVIVPTFAVESSSTRPSRISEIARAAAAIAERPSSGMHAGVRRAAVERHLERLRVRRAEDHDADRRRLVVDVADARAQPRVVERVGADEADLLLRREEQLDAGVRPALGEHAPRRLEHRRDGRLVVGAEDRPGRVPDDAVLDHRLDRRGRRHGVEVRAEEERLAVGGRLEPRVEVPHRRADPRPGVVLVDARPQSRR